MRNGPGLPSPGTQPARRAQQRASPLPGKVRNPLAKVSPRRCADPPPRHVRQPWRPNWADQMHALRRKRGHHQTRDRGSIIDWRGGGPAIARHVQSRGGTHQRRRVGGSRRSHPSRRHAGTRCNRLGRARCLPISSARRLEPSHLGLVLGRAFAIHDPAHQGGADDDPMRSRFLARRTSSVPRMPKPTTTGRGGGLRSTRPTVAAASDARPSCPVTPRLATYMNGGSGPWRTTRSFLASCKRRGGIQAMPQRGRHGRASRCSARSRSRTSSRFLRPCGRS